MNGKVNTPQVVSFLERAIALIFLVIGICRGLCILYIFHRAQCTSVPPLLQPYLELRKLGYSHGKDDTAAGIPATPAADLPARELVSNGIQPSAGLAMSIALVRMQHRGWYGAVLRPRRGVSRVEPRSSRLI